MDNKIRCPYCLNVLELNCPEGAAPNYILKCPKCKRSHELKDSLPVTDVTSDETVITAASATNYYLIPWILTFIASICGALWVYISGPALRGPDFLKYYLGTGVTLFIIQFVYRKFIGDDSQSISLMACIVFEIIGITRILACEFLWDMHKFNTLTMMMVFGGLLFFIRVNKSYGSAGWSSSCGGGCGSSCGGGGCGGCGS